MISIIGNNKNSFLMGKTKKKEAHQSGRKVTKKKKKT